MTGPGQENLL